MKRILLMLLCILALNATAQTVTRTQHRAAVTQDAVTTGTMNIRKPDYICISTNSGREQLIMDGTKFTMTVGSKRHVTDSRKNNQFTTFHSVLKAVINNQHSRCCKERKEDYHHHASQEETPDVHVVCPDNRLRNIGHQAVAHERALGQLRQLRY